MKALVLGAGGIGRSTAAGLRERGVDVTIGSRSGRPAGLEGVSTIAVDATDAGALARAASGSAVIVNAINPASYTHWARDWPPMAAAVLSAAERAGAGLVTISNLYGYGPHAGPLTEDLPLNAVGKGAVRAEMWRAALEAHDAGRVRVTEVRPSDYFGADARGGVSYLNTYVLAPAASGKPVRLMFGSLNALHSWTYLPDIGALAATLALDDRAWGRPWHVPTAAPLSVRQLVREVDEVTGRGPTRVALLPPVVRAALRVVPVMRSLDDTAYQFTDDFVLDSSDAQETFGVTPTPTRDALRATLAGLER